jgi:starvation-inducible outer membrane lipoprotein
MKFLDSFRRPAALAAFLIAMGSCLNACDRMPQSLRMPNMTLLSPRLQPLFQQTKTVFFGRFVVEVSPPPFPHSKLLILCCF